MQRPLITADRAAQLARDGELIVPRGAIITPLAADWLRENDVRTAHEGAVENEDRSVRDKPRLWGVCETPLAQWPLIETALEKDGIATEMIEGKPLIEGVDELVGGLGGDGVARGFILAARPAALACYANRSRGVRAVASDDVASLRLEMRACRPNLLLFDPKGKSFVEIRKIIAMLAASPCGSVEVDTAMLRRLLSEELAET
jgi:hypothetical protein